jgi:predicted phosphodiesterase
MDEFIDKLEALSSPGKSGSDYKNLKIADEWRPRVEIDPAEGGFLVTKLYTASNVPPAEQILQDNNLNPEEWKVTGMRFSQWQRWDGEMLTAFRVSFIPIGETVNKTDVEQLVKDISKWKPTKTSQSTSGEGAFVVAFSDQQIGKKAGSGGTAESVERLLYLTDQSIQRLKELRKIGRGLGTVVFTLLGDHVEGNTSQGGRLQSQAASDLGQTEQVRVARRILLQQVKAFAPLCDELVIAVVNGNHDEVTRQMAADPSDGWNVDIVSSVQDICAENDAFSHVKFRYPQKGHQTLAVEVCGTTLGLFHGHQFSGDVTKYISGQATGQTALGMADLWLSGHYHHFQAKDVGERLWVQAPTTDAGSDWFRDRKGLESKPGLLTLTIGEGYDPRRDLSILTTTR